MTDSPEAGLAHEPDPRYEPPRTMRDIKPISHGLTLAIDLSIWLCIVLESFLTGHWLGNLNGWNQGFGLGFLLACIGTAAYVLPGFMIIPQQQWVVFERFGRFQSVKFRGPRWRNRILDRERARGTLKVEKYLLYSDELEAVIDFTDASAPIVAKAYGSIGDPDDVAEERWDRVERQVALWVYRYEDPIERMATIIDGVLRPKLQALSIDEASRSTDAPCSEAIAEAREDLEAIAFYPPYHGRTLIVEDILLPPEIIVQRTKRLEGEANRQREEQQLQAPARAIAALQQAAMDAGETLTFAEAKDLVLTTRGFEMLEKTNANITLFGQNMRDVMKTFDMNPGKK